MTGRLFLFLILFSGLVPGGAGASGAAVEEGVEGVPPEFRLIGTYKLSKRVKVRGGTVFPVAIKAVDFRLYTDGITVRCYGGAEDAFTSFEIYRRDGITVFREDGLVESVPGIQAKSFIGDVLRQLAMTEETLVLSKFPALSDIVEITYAERVQQEMHQ